MPDASGRFRGISVPELPWLRAELEDHKRRLALIRAAEQSKAMREWDEGAR